ncbi:hypothetical protein OG948_57335 (plasmid) [Embleya sp. NBC_00888]|uniref:hypothetical protein n=1 Tax=Embleya sp. NBC_00888 TaxID=2975960 RepID=UPI002F919A5A|nr:hypothetical protein OG948_57335 [Embleya sp. NBC_00888]
MLPDHRPHTTEALLPHLLGRLNLPGDFPVADLDVRGVCDVATLAAAHSSSYAAGAHLLTLWAVLPEPGGPDDFWARLWKTSDSAYLLPANVKGQVLRALAGDGDGPAGQILSFLSGIAGDRRVATARVVGQALVDALDRGGFEAAILGEAWLRDVELAAWRVLLAARPDDDPADRGRFRQAWRDA